MATIGNTVRRLFTFECVHDFKVMSHQEKQEVMIKVAAVAFIALGLGFLATFISVKYAGAIPLAMILSAGFAFSANTDPVNRGIGPFLTSVLNRLRGSF